MSKRNIVISVTVLILGIILFNFDWRRISFTKECLAAEKELKEFYETNKEELIYMAMLAAEQSSIEFYLNSDNTIGMTFQDTLSRRENYFMDSTYVIHDLKSPRFAISDEGELTVVRHDTILVPRSWEVQFYGDYKDPRLIEFLNYQGWSATEFENLVSKVKSLEGTNFSIHEGSFLLGHNVVDYEDHGGLFVCFGHSDGYFDILFSKNTDEFQCSNSLKSYGDDFYGIEHWSFW